MQAPNVQSKMLQAGLNLIQQALSIFDSDLRLVVCNRKYQQMFNLPDSLVEPGTPFEDTIRYLVLRGEYGDVDDTDTAVLASSRTGPGPSNPTTWSARGRTGARSA